LHQEVVGGAVLGEEDEGHHVFGGGSGDGFAEVLDGGAEAVDDGLTLGGDARPWRALDWASASACLSLRYRRP
jgi:hypothetical protein